MKRYDFIVIGGGSAGFNAASTAVRLGKNVAVVDGAKELGGLCILKGCMPSKTLFYSTQILHQAKKARLFGLDIPRALPLMRSIQKRKTQIIGEFAAYRSQALHSGRFSLFNTTASFETPKIIRLGSGQRLYGEKFIIATGSANATPPIDGLAEAQAWTSDEILDLKEIPKSLIVLGGGVVACELAQFLARLGTKVTQVQRSPRILKEFSETAGATVADVFREEGIRLHTNTTLEKVSRTAKGYAVTFKDTTAGKSITVRAERLLNALGRVPNTQGLNLEAIGVATAADGKIRVNEFQQTSIGHIYAGGDVCSPCEVVHLAVAQGELSARHAFARRTAKPIDYNLLLRVVFTDPAVAQIGFSREELTARKIPFLSASYPFNDHGKSILMNELHGFVRVNANPKGKILGAEIVGPEAGELIHCFSGPIAMGATVHDLLRAPWYHPTLAEIITYPLEEIADLLSKRK